MILRKIEKLFYYIIKLFKYEKNYFKTKQDEIFLRNKLNRNLGVKIYKKLVDENNDLESKPTSEHKYIFSALSECKNYNIKKILEIGTFDGKNALLLSKLFPDSKIQTIDLPKETEQFRNTYNRDNKEYLQKFVKSRNHLLANANNIELIEINSINLVNKKKELYDLIWIDGAHGSPVVVIDIINALRLSNSDGLIFCDDVHIKPLVKQDPDYYSNASFETIKALREEKLIEYDLFLKRVAISYNYYPKGRKFIAVIKKLST